MVEIPWDVSSELRTITVVESIRMVVVIPNKNMDPGECDKGPLELQERREGKVSVLARAMDQPEMGKGTHRSILTEMQHTARKKPKSRAR
jgi:hypothetical protein